MSRAIPESYQIHARRGLTLAELMVGMTVSAILVASLASSVLIATRALPVGESSLQRTTAATEVLEQMAEDLRAATVLEVAEPTDIRFQVPDRDGDGVPESIRYRWDSSSQGLLSRTVNEHEYNDFLSGVLSLNFQYRDLMIARQAPPVYQETPESALSSFNQPVSPSGYGLTGKRWIGQVFIVQLPAETLSWRVTRVGVFVRRNATFSGDMQIFIRSVDADLLPTMTVLASSNPVPASTLPINYAWRTTEINNCPALASSQPLCMVIISNSSNNSLSSFNVAYQPLNTPLPDSWLVTTNNGDYDWETERNSSMLFAIHGKATLVQPGNITSSLHVYAIDVHLRVGQVGGHAVLETAVPLLNRPEVIP